MRRPVPNKELHCPDEGLWGHIDELNEYVDWLTRELADTKRERDEAREVGEWAAAKLAPLLGVYADHGEPFNVETDTIVWQAFVDCAEKLRRERDEALQHAVELGESMCQWTRRWSDERARAEQAERDAEVSDGAALAALERRDAAEARAEQLERIATEECEAKRREQTRAEWLAAALRGLLWFVRVGYHPDGITKEQALLDADTALAEPPKDRSAPKEGP
jgi:hypothetical protein